MDSKEQKQTEYLAGMQAHHHELQMLLPRSWDEYQTKFRGEHSEITKTMKDLSIIQHQAESEEKAGNEQQLLKQLSMVAQDNDAKHGDVNSRQEAHQEDDNLKHRNENIQEYKELQHEKMLIFSDTVLFVVKMGDDPIAVWKSKIKMVFGKQLLQGTESNRWNADGVRVENIPRNHSVGPPREDSTTTKRSEVGN